MNTTEMNNALHDLDDWIQRRNIMLQHSDLPPRQHRECAQELRTMQVARDALYMQMQPDPYLKDDEFLIVDGCSTELFSKEDYLPTPLPKGCVATPLNPWISVNERLPEEGETVLVSDGLFVHHGYLIENRWWSYASYPEGFATTHWMPMPPPPEVKSK